MMSHKMNASDDKEAARISVKITWITMKITWINMMIIVLEMIMNHKMSSSNEKDMLMMTFNVSSKLVRHKLN